MTMIKTNLLFNVNCNVFSTGGVPVLYRVVSTGCETATCNVVGVINMFTKTVIARVVNGFSSNNGLNLTFTVLNIIIVTTLALRLIYLGPGASGLRWWVMAGGVWLACVCVVVRGVVKLVSTPFAPFCTGNSIGLRPVRTCTGVLRGGNLGNIFVGNSSNRNCVLAARREVLLTRQ